MSAKSSTACLLAVSCLVGCGAPSGPDTSLPLVDDAHLPDVLVEDRRIEPPADYGGNRFVRGWFPWKHAGDPVLVPAAEGAVLELANLSGISRTLQLQVRLLGDKVPARLEIEVAGQPLEPVTLEESVRVPLPTGLPRGRVPIVLRFPKAPDPVVLGASLDRALPPGDVELGPSVIEQSPNSIVDFSRPVPPGARLIGEFEPPADSGRELRYALVLERPQRRSEVLFEWTGSWLDRLRGRRRLRLPLPGGEGLARIRLIATGSGAAATWHDLALEVEPSPATTPAALPPPPPRLVVLYVLDALRADFVDLSEGTNNPTPVLRRLAESGVVFARHSSVAPNTVPSTKSLFTGQPYLTRGHAKLAEDGPETLAEAFRAAGYRTAAFSGNGYISETYGTARGFEHLADEVVFREYPDSREAFNDNAARVQTSALAWLDRLGSEERAFVYLHTIHPHNPYDPPPAIADRLVSGIDSKISGSTRTLLDIQHNRRDVTPADQQRLAELYRGALAYNDAQIGNLLEALAERYPPQEVLLVVTSDHGEELFDHGGVLHGYTLYSEQLRIPLLLSWPGRLRPQHIDLDTDNLDLHESLRALIGAEASVAHEGRPFWKLLDRDTSPGWRPDGLQFAAASSVKGGIFMVRSERYKLILAPRVGTSFGMGEGRGRSRDPEYLFDLVSDPEERLNIAGSTDLEVAWMRSRLEAWIERGKYLERGEEEPELDEETRARLRALGYLE